MVFMSQSRIIQTADRLAERARRRPDGPAWTYDDVFVAYLGNLRNILDIGECAPDTHEYVSGLLANLEEHVGLGVFVRGGFNPLSPAMCAHRNIKRFDFISGKSLLVINGEDYRALKHGFDIVEWPDSAMYEPQTNSIVSKSVYYKRNPSHMENLSDDEIKSLGLEEALLDHQIGASG